MSSRRTWFVQLSSAAQDDYKNILDWTADQFGEAQSDAYAKTLDDAIDALSDGPQTAGVRKRAELAGLYLFHVARDGHTGRHFLIFRTRRTENGAFIDVLRILHDSMDLARHVPASPDE